MSLKLEEFRKRLLQQPEAEAIADAAVPPSVELSPQDAVVEPIARSSAPADPPRRAAEEMAAAVSKVFAQSRALQSRADEFAGAVESIERLSKAAARAFAPLRAFHDQLAEISGSFEALRGFQAQLAGLSPNFEPMKLLHDQVAQLTGSIELELGQVVKALDPAKDLSDRVSLLSRSLRQANDLQNDFAELYAAFQNANRDQAGRSEVGLSLH